MDVSIVTTYKNRRHHIEETLPTWISQATSHKYEIVITDYDSDDDLAPLLLSYKCSVPIKHVRCNDIEYFHLSHARNIGANYSSAFVLYFVDIDTILHENAIEFVCNNINRDLYLAATDSSVRKEIINGGLLAVASEHHHSIFGFNEDLKGWGFEDIDYKHRLERLREIYFKEVDSDTYFCLDHNDEQRTGFYEEDKEITWTKNRQIALRSWENPDYGQYENICLTVYNVDTQ